MIKKYLPWLIALLYFVNPYDVVPDHLLGPGWLDDLAVIGLVLWWVYRLKRPHQPRGGYSGHTGEGRDTQSRQDSPAEDPHEVLGVERGASKEDIKAAYKRLAAQYHPDKVQHLGKELQELAHKKFVAIQRAYDRLMN